MKGIFTQIKYKAQTAILREADNTGMIVGLPIVTGTKKVVIPNADDVTSAIDNASGHVPLIDIDWDNPAFNYASGDILQAVRVWIRKSNEDISAAHEIDLDPINITKEDYGTADKFITINPIKKRYYTSSAAEWDDISKTLNLDTDQGQIGDTVVISETDGETTYYYGTISALIEAGEGQYKYGVKWHDASEPSPPSGEITHSLVALYYNYIEDVSGTADGSTTARGYIIQIDYLAYRTSIYGVKVINTINDLINMFGEDALTNPSSNLACGAFLYSSASGWSHKFKICALDLRDQGLQYLSETPPADLMDSLTDWSNALYSHVDMHRDAYYLVPLTDNATVQDVCEAYVNTSSSITRMKEKRLYLAKMITGANAPTDAAYIANEFGNGKWGDLDYAPGKYYRDGYNSADGKVYFDAPADVGLAMSVPMPVNNERFTYIGCEYATVDNINIEGYYVAAIIAGWRESLPLGYDTSGMKVPLITSIACGLNHYSEDDYDDLSKSGWYMLKQDIAGGPVECYIQKTTAYESVEKGEESFIVALDYCMRDIRKTLAPFIRGGLDNRVSSTNPDSPVTLRYLNKLNSAIAPIRYKYVEQLEVFSAMEVIAIRVSEMKRTAAEIDVKFNHYYPVREITITGYVE